MLKIFTWLCLAAASLNAADSYLEIPDTSSLSIQTPSLQGRKTKKIRLNNGLEAWLISDPEADQSAAGLCVQVGSWSDPDTAPGMAHFIEHLLFLGTTLYPEESGFDKFVGAHGGESNAHTSETETCYFFSIDTDAFREGLKRFASFFSSPLFNPEGVSREIIAIDQEFALYEQQDAGRQWQVLKELAHPGHPFHRFNVGNKETLSKVERDTLLKWYEEHYSANLMHLVVYSSLDLDQLLAEVVSLFSAVPDRKKSPYLSSAPLTDASLQGSTSWVEPLQQERSLTFVWEIPASFAGSLKARPGDLISYVLGHEGQESLLAQLKREKLADAIWATSERLGDDRYLFELKMNLTKEGLAARDVVITRVFQTLSLLRQKGISRALFQDVQQMERLKYQYQTRERAYRVVEKFAPLMLHESLTTFPSESLALEVYDPTLIQNFLEAMTPARSHVFLMAPEKEAGVSLDRKEAWTHVRYRTAPFSEQQLERWSKLEAHPNIHIPKPNAFIPHTLDLIHPPSSSQETPPLPQPLLIAEDAFSKIYYAGDTEYSVPKIGYLITLLTPEVNSGDALKTVLGDLYVKSLKEALTDISYQALMADLSLQIQQDNFGIALLISGYSEHASLFLEKVLERLKTATLDAAQFRGMKEALKLKYSNASRDPATLQAARALKTAIYRQSVSESEKLAALRSLDVQTFNDYLTYLFRRYYAQVMLYGNLSKAEALAIGPMIKRHLKGDPYPVEEQPKLQVLQLSNNHPLLIEIKSKSQGNATLLAIEAEGFNFPSYAAQQLLKQAMKAPFYTALRTQQQTAYSLHNWEQEIEKHLFTFFIASSSSHASRDLLARFELFIEDFLRQLPQELSEEDFDNLKHALIKTLQQPPAGTQQMTKLLYELAFTQRGNFEWQEEQIQALKELDYSQFIEQAHLLLGKTNKRRLSILIKGALPQEDILDYEKIKNLKQLNTYETS